MRGISIVIPNSEGGCIIETGENRKKPKCPKLFFPSNSCCPSTCFINIQSFLSFICAFLNPVSLDLSHRILGHSTSVQPRPSSRAGRGRVGRGSAESAAGAGSGAGSRARLLAAPQPRGKILENAESQQVVSGICIKYNWFDLAFLGGSTPRSC